MRKADFMFYANEKTPMTSAGTEPATFRFVARHLKHRAAAVNRMLSASLKITKKLHAACLYSVQGI